jgi:hypothetical protein
MSRNLVIAAVAIVLAAAGFAGGWISGRATKGKSCYVLPAYTDVGPDPNDPYFGTTTIVNAPELVCK